MSTATPDGRTSLGHAVFFGGCVPASPGEEHLAYDIGATLAGQGLTLLHGGYNGLMERAARGAVEGGGTVVAVTLAGMAWGDFNPYVTAVTHQPNMGARMHTYLDNAEVIVSMSGGVGTLHELTAALWYAGNIRPVPVVVAGPTARRLLTFLRDERWVYSSPTRPLDFLHETDSAADLIPLIDAGHVRSAA
ncbi:LOG family protein [Micromonospora endolithica]|uniref:DNA transporter n=1 Tax=Micromonospora endolithica TaxID=230091 RepID=A0A3A9ZIN9_9ACTN|nr:LOG family protein [Micromonospora endolithica]RKN48220.1 DNA transporter [Micromonospora endolithica]TWJ24741.1 hypothetical protein JD76_04897 [Micromonospora endolithica]